MSPPFPVTIYHNDACSTSRNALAMIRAAGYEPMVVEYLKVGWTRDTLIRLLTAMGRPARAVLRDKGTPAAELGLLDPGVDDEALLDAMVAHPILVNRPIVSTPRGVALCRPQSEQVFALLESAPARFTKEDGRQIDPRSWLRSAT